MLRGFSEQPVEIILSTTDIMHKSRMLISLTLPPLIHHITVIVYLRLTILRQMHFICIYDLLW